MEVSWAFSKKVHLSSVATIDIAFVTDLPLNCKLLNCY